MMFTTALAFGYGKDYDMGGLRRILGIECQWKADYGCNYSNELWKAFILGIVWSTDYEV